MSVVLHTVSQGQPKKCPDLYFKVKEQIFRLPKREINIQCEAKNDFRLILLHTKVVKGEKYSLEKEKSHYVSIQNRNDSIENRGKNLTENRYGEREKNREQEFHLEV